VVRRFLRSRAEDDRGVVLVLGALLLLTLLGIAGFVVDLGNARQTNRQNQAATDAAALAAAQELPMTGFDSTKALTARNTAIQFAATSLHNEGSPPAPVTIGPCDVTTSTCTFTLDDATVTVTTPYTLGGSNIGAGQLVFVRACRPTPTFFAQAFGAGSPTVCKSSVARRVQYARGLARGLIALNPTACSSLLFQGSSDTNLHATGAVIVESRCQPNALEGGGTAWDVEAGYISVVGGYQINPCTVPACLGGTTPQTGAIVQGDPLRNLPAPVKPANAPGSCGGYDYCAGYYSNGLNVNHDATFEPGVYWIDGGFSSQGNGALTGSGVMFYVNSGTIDLRGGGALNLAPPASGPYQGISIFQARTNTVGAKINGNDNSSIGTIYIPNAHLDFQGNAGPSGPDFVTGMVIADTVTITGNGYLRIKAEEPAPVIPSDPDIGLER
jgi:Flp pilus assembly protein TadG